MFAYCNNNPVNEIDPDGENPLAGFADPNMSVVDNARPWQLAALAFGLLAGAFLAHETGKVLGRYLLAELSKKSSSSTPADNYVENVLTGVAGKYAYGKCKEAADDMVQVLKKNKQHGYIINIQYSGLEGRNNRNYVYSESRSMTVSENGFHCGVFYKGKVYCNIHPLGLTESAWINDFIGFGTRTITRIPF